ncbi:MAG: LysR family transcriptional regulator [Hyphomonadaceae bacterium]
MIDRRQLRYFLAVVEAGNFSRAAKRMNVTQATLSIGVGKLEESLGATLFFRNSQRVNLTDAGARFLDHARTIEHEFNRAEQAVGADAERGLVRLGVLSTIPTAVLELLVRQHQSTPYAPRLEIVEGVARDLMARLDRGRIDLALTVLSKEGKFASDWLYREGYALAVPAGHHCAAADVVDVAQIAGDVMIVRRHCEALSATSQFFTARGVRPEFSFRSDNDDRVLALVRAGLGITVMPESYADPSVKRPKLRGFDLQRDIGLLYAERAQDNAACGALVAAVRRAAADIQPR